MTVQATATRRFPPGPRPARPIRILFLTARLDKLGGSENNILALVKNLPGTTFTPYVLALQGGELLQQVKGMGVYAGEVGLKSILSREGLVKGYKFLRFLRERQVDILVTYHEDADIWGGLIGRLAGVPVIVSNRRDMGYQVTRKHLMAYRYINRCFHGFIAVSHAVKMHLVSSQGIPESKVEVIYNGVEQNGYNAHENKHYLHALLNVPTHHRMVGMVGSFRPVKGQEFFVRAAAKVLEVHQDVEFVIAGYKDTDYYTKISALIDDLGIRHKVHCIGHRTDVARILTSLDIFVLSSLHEGFSNALLEAMANGLPVIGPNSGGNPEIVAPSVGILFEPGNVDQLSRAIIRLLDGESERMIMGNNGVKVVRETFSLRRMIDKYESLLVTMLETK